MNLCFNCTNRALLVAHTLTAAFSVILLSGQVLHRRVCLSEIRVKSALKVLLRWQQTLLFLGLFSESNFVKVVNLLVIFVQLFNSLDVDCEEGTRSGIYVCKIRTEVFNLVNPTLWITPMLSRFGNWWAHTFPRSNYENTAIRECKSYHENLLNSSLNLRSNFCACEEQLSGRKESSGSEPKHEDTLSTVLKTGTEDIPSLRTILPIQEAGSLTWLKETENSEVEVMCVDDDVCFLRVVSKILKRHSFQVTCCSCAEEALRNLLSRSSDDSLRKFPSVILMDVNLPERNGLDAVKDLRALYPNAAVPVIMMSSDSDTSLIADSFEAGASDHTVKPMSEANLISRVLVQLKLMHHWHSQLTFHEKHRRLLQEMIPSEVISRLVSGERLIYDYLPSVSILFTDIVSFTELAAAISTSRIIQLLDTLFTRFDKLTEKHGVYKVETIGDAYMVAAGHENRSKDDHAHRVLRLALDMLEVTKSIENPLTGEPLAIRVGIHSGPSYAGVVGRKMPRYCFFGDTVNTASRMESTGRPGVVQISNDAYLCLKESELGPDLLDFPATFKDLGRRSVKGKGAIKTWLVEPVRKDPSDE